MSFGDVILTTKLSPLTLSVVTALTVFSATQAIADANYGNYGEETALKLASDYKGRYTGSDQEIAAANYMKERMTIAGSNNEVELRQFLVKPTRGIFRGQTLNSNNVVVTQKGTTDKTLIVGAHYDSAVAGSDYKLLEALDDNASGSGVLSELVKNLDGIETEHNIEFVAFGAEEGGLNGARAFAAALTPEQRANALGMINLDSLITGDFMYGHSGNNSYDAEGNLVPANVTLRDNAHRIAKELGIELKMNPALIPEGQTEPYKPAGVGCCSDQEAFDGIMQVVGFEATNWELGADLDGYTQTDNPLIEDGYTWHTASKDNKEYLVNALGEDRIAQRMRDFSRIVTRLIVEQTNADIIASNKSALNLQNTVSSQLKDAATGSHSAVIERTNANALGTTVSPRTGLWFDASQTVTDSDDVNTGIRAKVGIYGEYAVQPNWRLGLGVQGAKQDNRNVDNGIEDDDSLAVQVYSLLGNKNSSWWNTTSLTYAKHDLDTTRNVRLDTSDGLNIIDNQENGSVDADVFSAYNELGYNFLMNDKVKHGAYLALNYATADIDGYVSGNTESRTALAIDETSSDTFDSELGYQMQYNFDYKGAPVKLQGKLGYVHVIDDGMVDSLSTVSLADGQLRDVNINQVDADDNYGRFGLSVSSKVHKSVNAYLNGDTTFGGDNNNSAVQVGLQYQF